VIFALRFIGLIHAAVWFGSVVYFSTAGGPAFFTMEMKQLLGVPYAGAAAQILLRRYFILQIVCGVIALGHFIIERLYTARAPRRWIGGLIVAAAILGGGLGWTLGPRMKQLHLEMYAVQTTPTQKDAAKKTFWIMHGTANVLNLFVLIATGIYLWQIGNPTDGTRFASGGKFRP
jgi:hypothetical protein